MSGPAGDDRGVGLWTDGIRARGGAVVLAVAVGVAMTSCSSEDSAGDDTTSTDESTTTAASDSSSTTRSAAVDGGGEVEVVDFAYLPGSVAVGSGQSVTWTNNGDTRHSITSEGDTFASSTPLQPGQAYVQAFPTPGSYAYYCTFHPDEMRGTITVS